MSGQKTGKRQPYIKKDLLIEDRKPAKEATYEESKDEVRDILFQQKLPVVYQMWMQEKMNEYYVEILLNK